MNGHGGRPASILLVVLLASVEDDRFQGTWISALGSRLVTVTPEEATFSLISPSGRVVQRAAMRPEGFDPKADRLNA